VSYFAAAVARGPAGWAAVELDLNRVADLEDVADLMRDVDAEAALALLFVEADDEYLAIARLDDGEDLRVFGSDASFADESRLGAVLLAETAPPVVDLDDEEDPVAVDDDEAGDAAAPPPDADPVGDPELLADLGVPAAKLLALCAREGLLPSDVTAEVGQTIGCADEIEALRE